MAKFDLVKLVFTCHIPDDEEGNETAPVKVTVELPRFHAQGLVFSLIDGGTPESAYGIEPADNTWLSPEDFHKIEVLQEKEPTTYIPTEACDLDD